MGGPEPALPGGGKGREPFPGTRRGCAGRPWGRSRCGSGIRFDYYPVEQWIDALVKFPYDRIIISLNGGEPMLDRKNMHTLIDQLTATGAL